MRLLRSLLLPLLAAASILFFLLPLIVVIVVSFTPGSFVRFPPGPPSLRWYVDVLTSTVWLRAFVASAILATLVAIITSLASAMAVITLRGGKHRRARWLLGLVCGLPLLLPQISLSIAFLAGSATLGLSASYLVIGIAHCVLALPFAYRPILASFDRADPALHEAATILGARPGYAFWHVQLPSLGPGLLVAAIFTFITSFDEVTVTLFLVGPGVTTLPVQVLAEVQESASPAVAVVSTLMIFVTIAILALIERVLGLSAFVEMERSR